MSRRTIAVLFAVAMVAAACGGDDTPIAQDDPVATPTTEAAPQPTATTEAPPPAPPAPAAPTTPAQPTIPVEPTATATPVPPPAPAAPPAPAGAGATDFGDLGGAMGEAMEDTPQDQPTYDAYVTIADDTGAIQVSVPEEWAAQVDGRPYTDAQGRELFDVRAAPDLEAFATTWTTPGVIVTASREVAQTENEVTLLDELVEPLSGQCTYLGREPYSDPLYDGQFDVYDACGGTDVAYVVVGAVPESRAFVVRVQVQVTAERDLDALQAVLQSFQIVGDV